MLDNVIDCSRFPLDAQKQQARGSRRLGLGITGLADCLIMLRYRYGDEDAIRISSDIMAALCHQAYRTSIELAREKGSFPFFDRDNYLKSHFIKSLPDDIREDIASHGIRNSHLTAIAPAGTISLLAGNVSSGLEPVFQFTHRRKVIGKDGQRVEFELQDYAYQLWREQHGEETLPPYFVDSSHVDPFDHLAMQAALQPYVDNAVSKTINVPADYDYDRFKELYQRAYQYQLKGCTTFRPSEIRGEILSPVDARSSSCCAIEREAD
jgi:ribonucleoside-diphosphate reductase alpha chain